MGAKMTPRSAAKKNSPRPPTDGPDFGLTKAELAAVYKTFRAVDTSNSGTVEASEFATFLALEWRQVVPRETVDSVLALAQPVEEGKLQFHEFLALHLHHLPLCRGYCRDCKRVIQASCPADGYCCGKCRAHCGNCFLPSSRFFALCAECFEKEAKLPHRHGHDHMHPIGATRASRTRLTSRALLRTFSSVVEPKEQDWYRRNLLRPIVATRYKSDAGAAEAGFWGWVVDAIVR